jgi:DNA-cytosine methyltransferase
MKHGSLFSGIGGFDLAAEWMGWENIFHCEIAEFPRQILKYHFPNSICYEDIKKTDFRKHRGEVDIISGGFPCQPYSNAGKRRGKEDDRHLWPEMLRVIREVQPRFVVGENVAGLLSWNNGMVFHEIITDLENEGYETQAVLIPACATNAPHRRDRIFFIAHSNNARTNERMQFDAERKENDEQWRGQSQSEYRENGINGITTDTDSNGFKQQRGYDGSGKNDERSNTSVKWSSNSENIDNASSSEFIKKQSEFNRRISKQTNGETKEFAITNRICKLDKKFDECKEIECRNKCKIDNSRTLVQKGQGRVQLSEYIGMEFDKTNLSSKSTNGHTDDKNGINRMEGITTDTNNGSGLFNTVQTGRTEFKELHDSPSNVAHTDGTEQRNNFKENIGEEREIRRGEEGNVFGEFRGDGIITDTESQRAWEQSSEDRGWEDRRFDNDGEEGNVADTNCERHEERNITTESIREARFNSEKNFTNHSNWENFPTQSPICGGDDGIPTELDGITFPKWRNESIKGYGNAVVPQVVYQIFKAIEQSLL